MIMDLLARFGIERMRSNFEAAQRREGKRKQVGPTFLKSI